MQTRLNRVDDKTLDKSAGVLGPGTRALFNRLGSAATSRSGDARETVWLYQRLSLAILRGNHFSIISAGLYHGINVNLTRGLKPEIKKTATTAWNERSALQRNFGESKSLRTGSASTRRCLILERSVNLLPFHLRVSLHAAVLREQPGRRRRTTPLRFAVGRGPTALKLETSASK